MSDTNDPATPGPTDGPTDGPQPEAMPEQPAQYAASAPAAQYAAPEPVKERGFASRFGKRAIGLVVVVAVGLGIQYFRTESAKSGAPEVSDCVVVTGSGTNADVKKASCKGDALYKVTAKDAACDKIELEYTMTFGEGDDPAVKLCLDYNVEAGDCIKVAATNQPDVLVDCKANVGAQDVVLITKVNSSAADPCPKGSRKVANTKRDTSVCGAANNKGS